MPKYIDCTPTWESLLPVMLELKDQPNIAAELQRMAQQADLWVEYCKQKEQEK